MYTLCPNCKYGQKISRKQLKKKQGQLNCSQCKTPFNGYLTLTKKKHKVQAAKFLLAETQPTEVLASEAQIPKIPALKKAHQQITETTQEPDTEVYAWQKKKAVYRPGLWLIGIILGLLLFSYQIYYFKAYTLSQNPQIRPWLNILSSISNTPLPDYRKPLEFTTVGSSLEQADTGHYRLQVSLINHAEFRQPPPYLQLTLQNFYGGVFAQRIFSPQEYLGKTKPDMFINRSAALDIDFLIAMPEQEIGGYTIELK